MDLSAIIDEFNRRKAQAGQRISDMFTPPKKPDDWFQQMQGTQQKFDQRDNIHTELARIAEQMAQGMVPPMIRERAQAMKTDPSAAAKPCSSEEIKQATPFVTAAAPIAFHGTPHTFDKFDASKIGTGQGAQSYGHGLYFAENPEVAKSYQGEGGVTAASAKVLKERAEKVLAAPSGYAQSDVEWANKTLKDLATRSGPNMYQVNIPDRHAARMLDWDKPLSEQAPEVQKAVSRFKFRTNDDPTGEQIYRRLQESFPGRGVDIGAKPTEPGEQASALLSKYGIPGIKYLDQGSRDVLSTGRDVAKLLADKQNRLYTVKWGESELPFDDFAKAFAGGKIKISDLPKELQQQALGTRNFVVFDPAILQDVTRK